MIILNEFVDFIKVIGIKMIAFYAETPLDRFGKELRFISVGLGDFVRVVQSWIVALTLRKQQAKAKISASHQLLHHTGFGLIINEILQL